MKKKYAALCNEGQKKIILFDGDINNTSNR